MSPINIVLSFLAMLLSFTIIYIHKKSNNIALILLSIITMSTNLTLIFGAFTLTYIPSSSSSSSTKTNATAFTIICELQSFLLNTLGMAVYGACLSLAIELKTRTSSNYILGENHHVRKWRVRWYIFLSIVLPICLTISSLILRNSRAQFLEFAYCDTSLQPVVFLSINVVPCLLYTLSGSYFTVISVYYYVKKKATINRTLKSAQSQSNISLKQMNSTNVNSRLQKEDDQQVGQQLQRKSSQINKKIELSQLLLRMIIWCIGYHLLALIYVCQATYETIVHVLNQSVSNDPGSRATTVLYVTSALSILLFICFGTGRKAIKLKNNLIQLFKRKFQRSSDKKDDEDKFKQSISVSSEVNENVTHFVALPDDIIRPMSPLVIDSMIQHRGLIE